MKMNLSNLSYVALSVALLAQPLLAEELKPKPAGDAAPMMVVDRSTFVSAVSSANEFEIKSSELALQNASSGDLKEAAKMIIADHQKAGEKLKGILDKKGAPLPSPIVFSPKHQKMLDQLQAAKGKYFDTLYLDMQVQAHLEAIALFRTYAGSGDDQTVVGFAKETLPSPETHLSHVKMVVAKQ
jgi:putative membrane protein